MERRSNLLTYSELAKLHTFTERFNYLALGNLVGAETFGYDRYLNQVLYHSKAWRDIRDYVITRDLGCDLGIEEMPIRGRIIIHHMNPVLKVQISEHSKDILDPEFLVCVSHETHNAIHYGSLPPKAETWSERTPNDTIPWR